MIALGLLFVRLLCDRFKPRQQLEAEILVLRHQLNIDTLEYSFRKRQAYQLVLRRFSLF